MKDATTSERVTFGAVLERLYDEKHTGPVVVHFAQGSANVVEIPGPPVRIVLDKRNRTSET